jgi:hypothetical protein
MKKYIEIEIAVTFVVFWLLIIITSISQNPGLITGYTILSNPEEGQSAIQQILRNDIFNSIGNGAKLCINIKNNEDEIFSYKVRKHGGHFRVEEAMHYCDGVKNEDFVFTFENYDTVLKTKKDFNIDLFKSTTPNDNFKIWESSYVKVGGMVMCDDNFKDRYCSFLDEQFTKKEQKALGINCCTDTEKQSLTPFGIIINIFKRYIWLISLILIGILLGIGTILLLGQTDEEIQPDIENQLRCYIEEARRRDFGDKDIKCKLLEAGWEENYIDKTFNNIRKEHLYSLRERFEKIYINTFKEEKNTIKWGEEE